MPGAPACRSRAAARSVRSILLASAAVTLLAVGPTLTAAASAAARTPATAADGIRLPVPVRDVDPLQGVNLGLRKDRLLKSVVPGTAVDREDVVVALGPGGAPAAVTDTQKLVINGAGNYIVRELGPARAAVGLGDTVPPVLELGTVVWMGFSPGHRALAARLTLDPGIEAARLPLKVSLQLRDDKGHLHALDPGGTAPVAGTLTVTLTNQTSSLRTVDTGTAGVTGLAGALDRLRKAADHPHAAVPPVAGAGLPTVLPGQRSGERSLDVVAPLRISGTLRVPGTTPAVTGPGTTPLADGVAIAGTLSGSVDFTVPLHKGQRVAMTLDVRPWPDPRTLAPPSPANSWRQWAASSPTAAAVASATDTLVAAAAASARAAEYSPYLQADAPGPDLSTFTYVIASAAQTRRADHGLQPRPGAIALTVIAAAAVVGNAALLRRRF
ncbi:MAG TPA: hypothetical protein VFJ17_03895 [Mycobacteriales bacterium]|jgi:hypothetical protein|nr:hypothetical protein [Mycobacteriales bacterium]